jgi:putative acetyltransferase
MGIEFRKATDQDSPEVKSLIFEILKEYGLTPEPSGTDKDLSELEATYFTKGGYFEVCLIDGRLVGTWGIFPLSREACELRKMYLHPRVRGQGLGKQLLERALACARKLGYKRVELETASVLVEAVQLYRRYGFKSVAKHSVPRCDQAFELEL